VAPAREADVSDRGAGFELQVEIGSVRIDARRAPQPEIRRIGYFVKHERTGEEPAMHGVVPEIGDRGVVSVGTAVALVIVTRQPIGGEPRTVERQVSHARTLFTSIARSIGREETGEELAGRPECLGCARLCGGFRYSREHEDEPRCDAQG
jgi:hypothetical protein